MADPLPEKKPPAGRAAGKVAVVTGSGSAIGQATKAVCSPAAEPPCG